MNGRSRPQAAPETPAKRSSGSIAESTGTSADDALFAVERQPTAYGVTTTYRMRSAAAERDAGMEAAAENAGEFWRLTFDQRLRYLAATGRDFTTDDLREVVPDPVSPNAVGAMFASAAKSGLIVKVGYRPSERPEGHRRIVAVWRGAGR